MVDRRLEPVIGSLLAEEPVVALQGPRAVGKTTLLRRIGDAHGVPVLDLDDLATRRAVAADPALFVTGPGPVLIDEYQHVPALLDAIKAELNRDGRPGRFLITGSTRHDALPTAAQTLTGRLQRVTVLPFSQGELAGTPEGFLDLLRTGVEALVTAAPSTSTRDDHVARVVTGGFPLAVGRTTAARERWFDEYVALSLERDVRELARIRQREALPRLLARLAAQTAQLLNLRTVAEQVGLTPDTGAAYTRLLEDVHLVHRLPAWGRTLRARAVATPKLHVVDPGLAARLLRLSAARLADRDPVALQQFGHLLETFVVGEVRKQAQALGRTVELGHWRTHDGAEVDLVVEFDDGRVAGVEVKTGGGVEPRDLRGLRRLRDALGTAFVGGVLLHTGVRSHRADDRLAVLPVDRLWTAG